MFPTSLEHPYAPRGRRRGRNDPNSRDYICPCGKSYLSYPALFTHIKIKHNGRAPGQIIKPKSQNPSKRGRPRQKQVYDSQSDTNDIAANCIDRLCDFVTQFQKPEQKISGRLKDLYMKDAFYKVYVNYNPQQQQPRYNQREDLYEEYCDNVFCEVIAEVNKRLNEPFHIDAVIVFFMMLANFINESTSGENIQKQREYDEADYNDNQQENPQQGDYPEEAEQNDLIVEEDYPAQEEENMEKVASQQKIFQDYQNQEEGAQRMIDQLKDNKLQNEQQDGEEDFFYKLKQQPIRNIVNYINSFILSYPSKYCQLYELKQFSVFKEENVKLLIELLFNWLTMKKYIGYKVKINKDYK